MTYSLKVHIGGQHEFNAQGDKETVERQFSEFTELVRSVIGRSASGSESSEVWNQSIRTDGEVIFLAAVPSGQNPVADAALIILWAHQLLRNEKAVRGNELLDGLKKSGLRVTRIDRALGTYLGGVRALVVKKGVRRGVTYQLTERGTAKAKEITKALPDKALDSID